MKQVKDSSADDSTSKTRLEKVKYLWSYAEMSYAEMVIHTQFSMKKLTKKNMFFNLSFPFEQVNEVLNQIVILRDHVHNSCDVLCRAAVQGDVGELHSAMGALQDKASIFLFLFLLQ